MSLFGGWYNAIRWKRTSRTMRAVERCVDMRSGEWASGNTAEMMMMIRVRLRARSGDASTGSPYRGTGRNKRLGAGMRSYLCGFKEEQGWKVRVRGVWVYYDLHFENRGREYEACLLVSKPGQTNWCDSSEGVVLIIELVQHTSTCSELSTTMPKSKLGLLRARSMHTSRFHAPLPQDSRSFEFS